MNTPIQLNGVHLKRVYYSYNLFEKHGRVSREYVVDVHGDSNVEELLAIYEQLTDLEQEIEVTDGPSQICNYCAGFDLNGCCLIPGSSPDFKASFSKISASKFDLKVGDKIKLEEFLKIAKKVYAHKSEKVLN